MHIITERTRDEHTPPQSISGKVVYDLIGYRMYIMTKHTLTEHTPPQNISWKVVYAMIWSRMYIMCCSVFSQGILIYNVHLVYNHLIHYISDMFCGKVCSRKVRSVIVYILYHIILWITFADIICGRVCSAKRLSVIMYILYHII